MLHLTHNSVRLLFVSKCRSTNLRFYKCKDMQWRWINVNGAYFICLSGLPNFRRWYYRHCSRRLGPKSVSIKRAFYNKVKQLREHTSKDRLIERVHIKLNEWELLARLYWSCLTVYTTKNVLTRVSNDQEKLSNDEMFFILYFFKIID